jgi:hypothetical protein
MSLILADFASVDNRQFFPFLMQVIALRSIKFTLRCQPVIPVVCLRCHVVFMKFPWKFNFLPTYTGDSSTFGTPPSERCFCFTNLTL